jgi:ABC-2 type transport system permease protein
MTQANGEARRTTGPSAWSQRMAVAGWEFRRFIKPKQMLFSLVFTLVLGGVGYFLAHLANRQASEDVEVAVVGASELALAERPGNGVVYRAFPAAARDSLVARVAARKLDGVLEVDAGTGVTLHVRRERPWQQAVALQVAGAQQELRLRDSQLTAAQLAALTTPAPFAVKLTDEARGGRTGRIIAVMSSAIVLYGVFMAMALMLVSVTAEKQLRVTEQLVAAIRPQEWIDGKIIGIAGASVVNVMLLVLSGLVYLVGRALATGNWAMPDIFANPLLLVLAMLFAVLGFAFWLTFFGAIAATIDDPNTSTRGPMMFVPMLFQSAGFFIIRNPDSTLAQVLGLLPLTASGVMPVRLASTDVPWWEIALSAALLLAGTLLLRRVAGRIFALGMLMTGKEPTWGEIRRWAREA